ncbi:RING finger protein 207-like [Crassostrea angulata]|uniref:RING finger protein 207-like n=1 Tax=Magallana angulata TaxID=2784310 RepID=UPI0022B10190|nr:RING finger protein 207-like [Crassostrea angulata]
MADSSPSEKNLETDITTTCPICFESFKTPRILPCMHTFCHNCLSSYILSTCKTKDSPVGFPCPLCRRFVPAPSFSVEVEKWTELIPVNKIIHTLSEKGDKLCDACTRADEEIEATEWCESCSELLCDSCVKYHKSAVSKNHSLIPIVTFKHVSEQNKKIESPYALCQEHNDRVKYLCVDHEELCCTKCVCTKHRKCTQIDGIEEAAENLRKSGKFATLSKEISKYEDTLVKTKSEGEDTIRYIDDTSDQIRKESTEFRDKIVNHVDALLEDHLSELAQNIKQNKDRVAKTVAAVSDRHLLMAQYLQTLRNIDQTPLSILVQDYLKIRRQFEHVTRSSPSKLRLNLHSHFSEDLPRILQVTKFSDIKAEIEYIPLRGIDFSCACMKMICDLTGSKGDITGGCFLQNGDIVLASNSSKELLHYRNYELVRKVTTGMQPRDVVQQTPLSILVSEHQGLNGNVGKFDFNAFKNVEEILLRDNIVYSLAVSSGFVYAACLYSILKLDSKGNVVQQYKVDECTYSVAINHKNEVISSSCDKHNVTVMDNSGKKMYLYTHEKLKYPYGLDVNFSGEIFVAGKHSNTIHVSTPTAELLKIYEIESPRCIKFKENSNICFVGSRKTKVYEFREDLQ